MPRIHLEHDFVLPGISTEQAWQLIADTDSLNRLTGFPPISGSIKSAKFGNTKAVMSMRGFPNLTWEEGPFEFVRPRTYRVQRRYIGGPLESFEGGADVIPQGNDVRIHLVGDFVPRGGLLSRILRFMSLRQMRLTGERLVAALATSAKGGGAVFVAKPTPLAYGGAERIAERMAGVRAVAPSWARKFEEMLRDAPDMDLLRMRPFAIADAWGAPRLDVLRTFLHATKAELVNMSWDIHCPHCRVPAIRGKALSDVSTEAVCPACDLDIVVEFDTAVEVSFAVHPAVRPVEPVQFCMGAPAKRAGVVFQQVIGAGETRTLTIPLLAGDYALTRADSDVHLPVQVGEGPREVRAIVTEEGVQNSSQPAGKASAAAGEVTFSLTNRLDGPARISLALANASQDSASAAIVTSLQDFRDLFSSQVLAQGVQMGVSSVTLLFTDLKGSTAMYEKFKDAPVFARVREHFEVLTQAVAAEGGGVVKTIGDAVMASFPTPAAGVRAAMVMQQRIHGLNRKYGSPPELIVKVGLHTGPCLAINANDRLDYFGNTVNTAARIEGQSAGGDVVMTEAVASNLEVARILEDPGVKVTRFETALKGLSGVQKLIRMQLSPL